MTRCKTCGSVLRDHRDPARTQLQAFAEACPEVPETLELLLAAPAGTLAHGIAIGKARDLLRRMTAPAAEEK